MTPCCQTFAILMSLQHGSSLLPDQKNDGGKFSEQSGLWEAQDGCLVLPSSLVNPIFDFDIPLPPMVHLR